MLTYEVERGDNGLMTGLVRRDSNGMRTRLAPGANQAFLDAIGWFSRNREARPHEYADVPLGFYFVDYEAAIAAGKEMGWFLFVPPPDLRARGDRLQHGLVTTDAPPVRLPGVPTVKFHQITACGAPGDSWPDPDVDDVVGYPFGLYVSTELLQRLNAELQDERSDVRGLSSWPVERTFVYFDISDFSKHKPGQQSLIIRSLIRLTTDKSLWAGPMEAARRDLQASLCIGD